MKMNIYKVLLCCMIVFCFLQPISADDATIDGPEQIEAPYIAQGYVFYTCPDSYTFVELKQKGLHMQKDGTLVLEPEVADTSIQITAQNSEGKTIYKTINIQTSWVLTQQAQEYQIPKTTTPSKLQTLAKRSQQKEDANNIRICALLIAMLLFYLYIYIHHKIKGGDDL